MLSFPHVGPDLGHDILLGKVDTTNSGLDLKNNLSTLCLRGWGSYAKCVLFFNIFSDDLPLIH